MNASCTLDVFLLEAQLSTDAAAVAQVDHAFPLSPISTDIITLMSSDCCGCRQNPA